MSESLASAMLCCLERPDATSCLNQCAGTAPIKSPFRLVDRRSTKAVAIVHVSLSAAKREDLEKSGGNPITEVFRAAAKKERAALGTCVLIALFPHLECADIPPRTPSPTLPFQFRPSSTGENHSVPCHPANV